MTTSKKGEHGANASLDNRDPFKQDLDEVDLFFEDYNEHDDDHYGRSRYRDVGCNCFWLGFLGHQHPVPNKRVF